MDRQNEFPNPKYAEEIRFSKTQIDARLTRLGGWMVSEPNADFEFVNLIGTGIDDDATAHGRVRGL